MPETPCLFENQTAVFLKCAEIDCVLESAKKPRTAGLCGRTAGACDCGPLSCAKIERVNKGRKPPKRGMAGRENPSPKARFPIVGAGCTGPFHTSPTNAATFVSRGCGGYTRHPSPQPRTQRLTRRNTGSSLSIGHSVALCCQRNCHRKNSWRKWMHALWRVSAFAGVAAPLGCAVLLCICKTDKIRCNRFYTMVR